MEFLDGKSFLDAIASLDLGMVWKLVRE